MKGTLFTASDVMWLLSIGVMPLTDTGLIPSDAGSLYECPYCQGLMTNADLADGTCPQCEGAL